jgi:ABC-type multidrug transport system fused ATPase/permease subunit
MLSNSQTRSMYKLFGRQLVTWMVVGVGAALFLSVVEIGIAVCLQNIISNMGATVPQAELKTPLNIPWASSVYGMILIFAGLGAARAFLSFVMAWSSGAAERLTLSRFRQLELTALLIGKDRSTVAPSQIQFAMETIFPRAAIYFALLSALFSQLVLAVGIIFAIGLLNWAMCFIAVTAVVAIGVCVRKIGELINAQSTQQLKPLSDFVSGVGRVTRNWFFVRVMKAKAGEHARLSELNINATVLSLRALFGASAAQTFPQLAGIFLLSVLMAIQHKYNIGGATIFLQFVYLLMRLVQILTTIAGAFGSLSMYRAGLNEALLRFEGISDADLKLAQSVLRPLEARVRNNKVAIANQVVPNQIHRESVEPTLPVVKVENLSFSYDSALEVFHTINLDVRPGEQLGIIGPSGSGKSTLMSLILGLQNPTSGQITINGSLPQKFLDSDGSIVGYVGAEAFLVEGTIKDNLDYGRRTTYSDSDYIAAIQQARLSALIKRISGGLMHRITENGDGLSAGEKQRLSLARALLRKPKLLILDEVTANLDTETELEIAESLRSLKGLCTCLIVSHRAGILKHADRVYDLEKKAWAPMLKDLLREVI